MVASVEVIYGQRAAVTLFFAGIICVVVLRSADGTIVHPSAWAFDPWALPALLFSQCILGNNARHVLASLAIGVPFGFVLARIYPSLGTFAQPIAIGISSLVALSCIILISSPYRARALLVLAAGGLVIIGQQLSDIGQQFTTTEAMTFDIRAYLVDMSFGFDPASFTLALTSGGIPWVLQASIVWLLKAVYISITLVLAVVVLLHLRNQSPLWALALAAIIFAGAAGGLLYHVFPAAGPGFAFPAFPELPPTSSLTPAAAFLDLRYVRNCMPSLHATWAFLIVINSAGLSWAFRGFAVLFAASTLVATLSTGQHYLVDLIVAVPFTIAVQATARSIVTWRWPGLSFWSGSGLVAFWLFALRFHVEWLLTVPRFTLAASLLTIAISVFAYRLDARHGLGMRVAMTKLVAN